MTCPRGAARPAARAAFAALGTLVFSFAAAFSEEARETDEEQEPTATGPVYRLPPVIVRAPRPVTSVGGSAAIEAEVDSLALPAAATTEEVFRQLPLLHVRKNSRGEAEISARGSESRQVAVLVDGVPITLAWDARADVSVIPATALHEAVFVRGLSSMLYGPNVLGGIVEAHVGQGTVQPAARSAQITMGADDVGTFGTTALGAVPFRKGGGAWLARGGVGFRDTPGDPLAKGVDERPSDDDLRLNTDARHVDGFAALRYRADGGAWLAFSGSSFRAERGIAAELGAPDDDARFWRYPHVSRTLAVVSGGTGDRESPFGGQGDVEASLGFDSGRTEIDAYTSAAYDELDTFEDGEDRTLTLRLLGDQTLGSRSDLRSAFTLAEVRHREIIPDGEFEYRQRLWSGGTENLHRLYESNGSIRSLAVSVGGAYDVAETREAGGKEPLDTISQWGGRVGLSAVVGSRATVLHAGVSRRGRFPALRELYSGALNRFVPNPDLEPEEVVAIEVGATSRLGGGEAQLVAFHNRVNDAVVRVTLPDRRFMRVNRNELRSAGVEFLGSVRLASVELSGHLTLQDVKLTDTAADETHEPENLPEAFGAAHVQLPVGGGVVAGAGVEYTGRQFAIDLATGDDAELDGAAVVGGYVSRTWPLPISFGGGTFTSAETRVAVDNVGDEAHYDQFGLPEPGRRIRFELRLR
jgi:iron complex outermembrane receptor protein